MPSASAIPIFTPVPITRVATVGKAALTINIAIHAPRNCATKYPMASAGFILPIDHTPTVTAGLMCVPEIDPFAYTKRMSTREVRTGVDTGNVPESESATVKVSANVPTHSATYFFIDRDYCF